MMDWLNDAACRDTFDTRAHGTKGEQTAFRYAYCRKCPVKVECLMTKIEIGEDTGCWGGVLGKIVNKRKVKG